jgi:hypothetical protein
MKDIYKQVGYKYLGPGGLNCSCCDSKLSHKRKSKINRNLFSTMRRSILNRMLMKELKDLLVFNSEEEKIELQEELNKLKK